MMKMNSIEAQTGIIEIPDASYEAVEVFLEFFYVGYAENLDIFVEELFVIADRYFVESLKVRNLFEFCIYCVFLESLSGTNGQNFGRE
jgi:hypothetical protein